MKHVTHIADLGPAGVADVLNTAMNWKRKGPGQHLKDKILGMVFFNPSLRTRTSFEAAMLRGGGHAIVLEVGGGVWKLEDREGVIMDQDRTEHLKEAVPVLGRYVDFLAVRSFSSGAGDDEDVIDPVINGFRKYSEVPVVSMESAREHPCQGLADVLTLKERFEELRGLPVTLTWAPHMKALPKAVPNSFLLSAAACGCDVRVAHPEGFDLHPEVMAQANALAASTGGAVRVTHDQREALEGSVCIYAKAWGPSTAIHPDPSTHAAMLRKPEWAPTLAHFDGMREDAVAMHCLPVRRNLEVMDDVLDSPRSAVIDEAENRFHVQRVLLDLLARQ